MSIRVLLWQHCLYCCPWQHNNNLPHGILLSWRNEVQQRISLSNWNLANWTTEIKQYNSFFLCFFCVFFYQNQWFLSCNNYALDNLEFNWKLSVSIVVLDNTTTICPMGYYCPEGTRYNNEYPCPIGTFNNRTGKYSQTCPCGHLY
jgi:hypothetical protein